MADDDFRLTSPAFDEGSAIPEKYTCQGVDASPPLSINGVPNAALELALIMHDPDAPNHDFLHWAMWNLSPTLTAIDENTVPPAALQGKNDFGQAKYGGPCPPSGTHRYTFDLYAVDKELNLPAGASREELEQALEGHVISKTTLTGTFGIEK